MPTDSENIAAIRAQLDAMNIQWGLNFTTLKDDVLKGFDDRLTQLTTKTKASKKQNATSGSDAPVDEKKEKATDGAAAKKATHPKFPKLAASAWGMKKNGANHEKISAFLVAMRNHYPTELAAVIGPDIEKAVADLPEVKAELNEKKRKPAEIAGIVNKRLWEHVTKVGKTDEVSKRVWDFFTIESAVFGDKKIAQVTPEAPPTAEVQAAAVVHTTSAATPAVAASTVAATPAVAAASAVSAAPATA